MISFYFRSSSVNTYKLCQLKHYLEYCLGHRLPSGNAASRGTAVHKALEILGLRQLAIQNGELGFTEAETGNVYYLDSFKLETAIYDALAYYIKIKKVLTEDDAHDCIEWFNKTITEYKDYTPLGQKVKEIEKYFDFELPYDWANYEYKIGDDIYKGKLSLKGTTDLIFDISPDTIEYCDFKTGKTRNDWVTGKQKDSDNLRDDFQLQLYFYALKKAYPEVKNIIMTLLYIRAGGPFSVLFTDEDLPKIENRIRILFEEIKKNKWPTNIKKGPSKFKCNWCAFKTTEYTKGISYCDYFEKEIQDLGLDKVTAKYIKKEEIGNYGSGGGRTG